MDATQLASEIRQAEDLLLFGGGVTLSGGEVMLQPEFAIELIEALKPLHVLIETCGYAPTETFSRVASHCDTVYFDLKLADRDLHRTYTGVYNDLILQNLAWLQNSGIDFRIRTPLIPGITDTDENLAAIATLAKCATVELLPYNSLAGAKYAGLGKNFTTQIQADHSRIRDTASLPDHFILK